MILLTTTNDTLELITGDTVSSIEVQVSYIDLPLTTQVQKAGHQSTVITSATTTTILNAPAASTDRAIKSISVYNSSGSDCEITVLYNNSIVTVSQYNTTLASKTSFHFSDHEGFYTSATTVSGGGGTDVTLSSPVSPTPDYITLVGQELVVNKVDLSTDVVGILDSSNLPGDLGATTLNELVDVDVSAAVDGQVLTYNSSSPEGWIATSISGGGGSSTVIAPFAFARIDTTSNGSGTGINWSNWNAGNGTLDITFDTAQANTDYTVVTDGEATDDGRLVSVQNKTTSGFEISLYDGLGAVSVPSSINPFAIIVYGETPTIDVQGGGGDVASDLIWDAKGDLVVGTGSNTATRLGTSGVNGDVLTIDSNEVSGLKWTTPQSGGEGSIGGTGSTNAVAVWSNSTTLNGTAPIYWNSGTSTLSMVADLDITGEINLVSPLSTLAVKNTGTTSSSVRLHSEVGNFHYVELKAPMDAEFQTGNKTYTLPADGGSAGDRLQTDGNGNLYFASRPTTIIGTDTIWSGKGYLAVSTGPNAATTLPPGGDNLFLTTDSNEASGLKWSVPPSSVGSGTSGSSWFY